MNERIRELAGKALDQAVPYTWTSLMPHELGKFAEQFSELIVRECLSIVEPTEDSGDEWCVTLKETAQEIKEHFGVE